MTGFDHPERMPRTLSAVTIVLTAAAGAIDVVTYFAFSQVFASTMTGNLVLLGLGLGQGDWTQVIDNVCAILGYSSGLIIGTLACGVGMRRLPWRNAVGVALTLELALLIAVGAFWWGVDDGSGLAEWKVIVLVVGAGLAMGIQGAAMRYIGPAGTPTSFLSGTVTNWVSSLVELHKPFSWNWNSPLRIGVMIVAAGGNAWVQSQVPDLAFAVPILLVTVGIGLMAIVTRANHGGLVRGEPEFAVDPRTAVPDAGAGDDHTDDDRADAGNDHARVDDLDGAAPAGTDRRVRVGTSLPLDGIGKVLGRVITEHGEPSPAAVTLVDMTGRQAVRVHTEVDGHFDLQPPEAGDFVLICTPHRMGGDAPRPRAVMVSVDGRPVTHDVVVGGVAATT